MNLDELDENEETVDRNELSDEDNRGEPNE